MAVGAEWPEREESVKSVHQFWTKSLAKAAKASDGDFGSLVWKRGSCRN